MTQIKPLSSMETPRFADVATCLLYTSDAADE